MPRVRVLVVDDHTLVREGVRALLRPCDDIEVVGEAADGRAAVDAARRLQPDVVLMDIAMPGLGGLEAALALQRDCPRARVLVLTQYEDREYVSRFLKLGVAGYVLKKTVGADLPGAIRSAHRGGLVLDPEVARAAVAEPAPGAAAGEDAYEALTDREKQVLRLIAEGCANKEIADALGISVKTAMTHRAHVMQKLDLHDRTGLVKFALKKGVIRL